MKRSIIFAGAAAMALMLGGCGKADDVAEADATAAASAKPNAWSSGYVEPEKPRHKEKKKKHKKGKDDGEKTNPWAIDTPASPAAAAK